MHGNRTASLTTLADLKGYFASPPWSGRGWVRDKFEGSRGKIDVKIWPETTVYTLHAEAVDDPSDVEDVTTEEPAKALAEFLGRDIPGAEHFERMSSEPGLFAEAMDALAEVISSGLMSAARAASALRRLASIPSAAEEGKESEESAVSELERDMKKKGWTVRRREDGGFPALEVDVHGIYRATIEIDSVLYGYSFNFRGKPDAERTGTTDDPIREFRGWDRSKELEEARDADRHEQRLRSQQRSQEQTVRA